MPVDKFGHTDTGLSQRIIAGGVTLSQVNANFLRMDGANAATGILDMNGHKVINVSDPTDLQDAATKNYVDKVSKNGDLLLSSSDAATTRLGCADTREGQRFILVLGNNENKIYYDNGDKVVLQTTAGFRVLVNNEATIDVVKTGLDPSRINVFKDIYMHGARITGLAEPTGYGSAVTKNYVDTTVLGPTFCATNTIATLIKAHEFTKVLFSIVAFDTDSKFSRNLSRFTPNKAGYYSVSTYVEFETLYAYGNVHLYKNGVSFMRICGGGGTGVAYNSSTGNTIVRLTSTDYLEIYAYSPADVHIVGRSFSAAYLRPDVSYNE